MPPQTRDMIMSDLTVTLWQFLDRAYAVYASTQDEQAREHCQTITDMIKLANPGMSTRQIKITARERYLS
jgi:hypothetical protein